MKRCIKLVTLDLDGTLLNDNHQLASQTIEVIRRLSKKGITFAVATGRSAVNVPQYFDELDLSQMVLPAVCYNGAIGLQFFKPSPSSNVHETVKSVMFENQLSAQETKIMINFCAKHQFLLQLYNASTGDCYAIPRTEEHHALVTRYAGPASRKQIILSDYSEALSFGQSAKALILDNDTDKILRIASEQLPKGMFNMFRGSPDPYFVEFLKSTTNKGNGLRMMCDAMGVDMKNVVAFGDGENDKEMLEFAGFGIAMKNAKDVPKEAADLILEWTNDEDGVARQLEVMESQGWFDVGVE